MITKEDIQLVVRIGGHSVLAQAVREELAPLCGTGRKKSNAKAGKAVSSKATSSKATKASLMDKINAEAAALMDVEE